MSKAITLHAITDEAISMLSTYNIAWRTAKDIRKTHNDLIKKYKADLEELQNKRKALVENGMSINEAISKISTLEINKKLTQEKQALRDDNKTLNAKFAEGRCMVDNDEVYNAYLAYLETGDNEKFKICLVKFFATIGIDAKSEWAKTNRFTNIIVARVSGVLKATGQARDDGDYVKPRSKDGFKDIFIAAFLQFMVKNKHILDENEDFTLTRHDFDADNNKAEEK